MGLGTEKLRQLCDGLREQLAREREANQRLEEQSRFDEARIRILSRKASAYFDEISALNREEEIFAAQRADRIREIEAEVKRLENALTIIEKNVWPELSPIIAKKALEE